MDGWDQRGYKSLGKRGHKPEEAVSELIKPVKVCAAMGWTAIFTALSSAMSESELLLLFLLYTRVK